MSMFDEALHFAIEAHKGMVRKGSNTPYIVHPLEAATIAATMTEDESVLCAAVLHDVVEDTEVTMSDIRDAFGPRVAELVASETEHKRHGISPEETWLVRKRESLAELKSFDDIDKKIIWLSDKLSNMRSFLRLYRSRGDQMWEIFHQKDPANQAWYYREIAKATSELSEYSAWLEFTRLIDIVFEGVA